MRVRGGVAGALRAILIVGLLGLPSATSAAPPSVDAPARPGPGRSAALERPTTAPAASADAPAAATLVDEKPCPDSFFTCITLRVPRDHFAASPATFDVTFALLRSTGPNPKRGTFVTVTGGPGTSGISAADGYTEALDPRIPRRYDIVFFDQRGIGLSEVLQCPDAALELYTSPHVPTVSRAAARAFARDSRTFRSDCIAETGVDPAELPYFSTRQAVEDLEAFREWLGEDRLDLYGESYGTQFAQAYAAAHPDRLSSLMLDGPVDLTLSGTAFYAEDVRAYEFALVQTLHRCSATRACRRDLVGRNALARYDLLAARLRRGPGAFDFVKRDGSIERRRFGFGDLETAAAGYMAGEFDRMTFQRAIAWGSRGELLPLARLAYISLGQDPETLEAVPDPTWSDAMYYAVECMDYAYGTGSAEERARHYLARGRATGVADVRLGSIFYGDLPCAYWPAHPPTGRPDYLGDTPYPVFVLASTWDPATPYAGALRIYRHLDDAYLIVQPGGPHIIFGRGNACPDNLITRFLVSGQRPAHRRTVCRFTGVDPYVRIPAQRRRDYAGPLAAMTAVDREINYSADFWNWDGEGGLRYGCLFGGWIRYRPNVVGYRVTLQGCRLTHGLALTGRALINDEAGTFRLEVTGPSGTNLVYRRDADGDRTVMGTWPFD